MTVIETKKSNKGLWIGLGAAALFCLCAVAFAAVIFIRMGQQVQEGMKTDPHGAAQAAHAIADYELPEGYQEQFAMDFLTISMVFISPGEMGSFSSRPTIMLSQFKSFVDGEQAREQMRQSVEQQWGRRDLSMNLVERITVNIRGEETDLLIYEGADDSGIAMRQLVTYFPGKDGTAMLMVIGPIETWDEEAIDAFIESIH